MGQHKYNPNCELAKQGKLPPKPKRPGAAEQGRFVDKLTAVVIESAIRQYNADTKAAIESDFMKSSRR